jgi:hypothetical protein
VNQGYGPRRLRRVLAPALALGTRAGGGGGLTPRRPTASVRRSGLWIDRRPVVDDLITGREERAESAAFVHGRLAEIAQQARDHHQKQHGQQKFHVRRQRRKTT